MRDEEVLSIGEHQHGVLEGLGRFCDKFVEVKDGVFSNGELVGIGAVFNPKSNKYIFGNYDENRVDIISEGYNWPQ